MQITHTQLGFYLFKYFLWMCGYLLTYCSWLKKRHTEANVRLNLNKNKPFTSNYKYSNTLQKLNPKPKLKVKSET